MTGAVQILWLAAILPLLAAAVLSVTSAGRRRLASRLAIGAQSISVILCLLGFVETLMPSAAGLRRSELNFPWLQTGDGWLHLGIILDPLSAIMAVMVSFVSLLIFIYSVGYMKEDENFTKFFCYLSLFSAAMLGLVMSNSLLLLFVCWELVGLASYLLIGFWYQRPAAAAAAKKAFITTRIGDLGLFLGMLWLFKESGTLLFYDGGNGCLEQESLNRMAGLVTAGGLAVSTGISLLVFCGAVGKSGQLPLHVWLPDAMEGPTPVSALIHAATMVAAGVFLVARMHPLMSLSPLAMQIMTWVGAITAVFAALIAVAQTDIKRVLAYSTVSQLGFMFLGVGTGGVEVGMFHLITHAFFKALLFLGAGSVIHGCHGEQDIRNMGGLRKWMPVTFATYAVGMMALSGVPFLFSGFWSKEAILHAAHGWPVSHWPFYLGLAGTFLTAFYMTRQVILVFLGNRRASATGESSGGARAGAEAPGNPHESPRVMTVPLVVLAACAVLVGFLGTPAWPWFNGYLSGDSVGLVWSKLAGVGSLSIMAVSILLVLGGFVAGWRCYGLETMKTADPLGARFPKFFKVMEGKFYVDEIYAATVLKWNALCARICDGLDRHLWAGFVKSFSAFVLFLSWCNRLMDEFLVNAGFNGGCGKVRSGSRLVSRFQGGQGQLYLRILGAAVALLWLALLWWRGDT